MSGKNGARVDVAIVGCGPVGAVCANLLGRDGFRVEVFEREREVYRLPRAAHFDHEIMRIFQSVGLADAILPHTRALAGYEFRNAEGRTLLRFPTATEPTAQGWRSGYLFFQPELEAVLRRGLGRHPGVALHLGWEALALEEDDDGVALRVCEAGGGSERTVRARYVIGCDGAASLTRRCAALPLTDLHFDEPWLVVDAFLQRPLDLPDHPLQICDPARPTTVVPMAGSHYRWEFMLRPGESAEEMERPERIAALLAAWVGPGDVEVIRAVVYRFHALIAERWNTRRTFLAGDSAHQMPPFLGQGMCSGIRDAANLCWKLGLELRGVAAPELLESYRDERSPHVRRIIDVAVEAGRIICTQDPELAAARDARLLGERERRAGDSLAQAIPPLASGIFEPAEPGGRPQEVGALAPQPWMRAADGREARLDDLVGPAFSVVCQGDEPPPWKDAAARALEALGARVVLAAPPGSAPQPTQPPDLWLEDRDGAWARWFASHGCRVVVVRPDHYVFGVAKTQEDAGVLLTALARQLRRPD